MRKTIILALLVSISIPSYAAPPGTAQNFLDRANRLKAKGPLAFFDSDYGRLKTEATAVGKAIGDDRIAAERGPQAHSLLLTRRPGAAWQYSSFSTVWKPFPRPSART